MHIILLCLFALFYCSDAYAIRTASGTGFFVSRQGQLVTNAHVVEPCENKEKIYFRMGKSRPHPASLVGMDETKDLALLNTGLRPNRIAALRWMHTRIQEDHKVFLMGYPEAKSITSPYEKAYATIKALEGPFGENQWLQFTDAARSGNSGGPLLDFGGNVVGVVTAKSKIMRMNHMAARQELVAASDIAVTAAELKLFLDRYRVHYRQADSVITLGERRLEQLASSYIVHIFCATEQSDLVNF